MVGCCAPHLCRRIRRAVSCVVSTLQAARSQCVSLPGLLAGQGAGEGRVMVGGALVGAEGQPSSLEGDLPPGMSVTASSSWKRPASGKRHSGRTGLPPPQPAGPGHVPAVFLVQQCACAGCSHEPCSCWEAGRASICRQWCSLLWVSPPAVTHEAGGFSTPVCWHASPTLTPEGHEEKTVRCQFKGRTVKESVLGGCG